jgi:hypothetical protein
MRTAPRRDAAHWHGHRVTMRRLVSSAGDKPRTRLPSAADARVGARSSCAVRVEGGNCAQRTVRAVGQLYPYGRALPSPVLRDRPETSDARPTHRQSRPRP